VGRSDRDGALEPDCAGDGHEPGIPPKGQSLAVGFGLHSGFALYSGEQPKPCRLRPAHRVTDGAIEAWAAGWQVYALATAAMDAASPWPASDVSRCDSGMCLSATLTGPVG
jgi:hypothetical protein